MSAIFSCLRKAKNSPTDESRTVKIQNRNPSQVVPEKFLTTKTPLDGL